MISVRHVGSRTAHHVNAMCYVDWSVWRQTRPLNNIYMEIPEGRKRTISEYEGRTWGSLQPTWETQFTNGHTPGHGQGSPKISRRQELVTILRSVLVG